MNRCISLTVAVAVVAAVGTVSGCANRISGVYANPTGTTRLTLNADGTGQVEVGTAFAGLPSSPFDGSMRFVYQAGGTKLAIEPIDERTGKQVVYSSKEEAKMMEFLTRGSISMDRKTVNIMGSTFKKQ